MKRQSIFRRSTLMTALVALLVSMVPFAGAAGNHEATRTAVTFTSTHIEELDPGEEWFDDAGIFRERGLVMREEVTGDISGTLIITADFDLQPVTDECTEESCAGYSSFWGQVEITGEDGGWKGTYLSFGSDVPGEEFFVDHVILRGTGANAHQSIYATSVDGDENSITFEGVRSTMATPMAGLNTSVRVCASPEDFSFAGGFLSQGAIEGDGSATVDPLVAGGPWTHSYAVGGTLTLTDEHGSVTIAFGGGAQDTYTDVFEAAHVWGHFMVLEGTGDYAELYGNGRFIATAGGPTASCASGFGINISLIGEAHYN